MPDRSIHDLIQQSFPKSNKEDWTGAVSQEIKGKNSFESLTWKTEDKINFFSYYDRQDCKAFSYLKNFEFPPSHNSYGGARAWQCLPKITVVDASKANAIALSHLANGADGLLFDISKFNAVDVSVLLDKIDWPYCRVSFFVTPGTKIVEQLLKYVEEKKYNPPLLAGTLFWKTIPQDVYSHIQNLSSLVKFHTLGIHVNASSPVKEISEALTRGTSLMDELTDQGIEKEIAWRNISLSFSAGKDFFLEIAKLKAFRLLWYQLAHAFQIKNYKHTDVQLHVRSEPWIDKEFEPHGNLLKSTVSALSAILGGCDALTIIPEDESNIMMNRIARNVSNILREEAHLDKVSDPVAGSYAVEDMVDKIAQAAWVDFQNK